ncbi:hypothetical protein GQ53DRAFT_878520 [Thozetella sp. PMI_491]|nr:hypothetical protein GQ53DRAFT_878520 [Thozetella sp. PMI_491]
MHFGILQLVGASIFTEAVWALLFPFENIQLTANDVRNFSAVSFGDESAATAQDQTESAECRAFPGTADWPAEDEWQGLNTTLGGALLKPIPVSSVCYTGPHYNAATCNYLLRVAGRTHFYLDDPLTSLTPWTQGETCMASLNPVGNCTQGGFPVYVVNATTAKHVQAAVNFARNKKLRLVIKNTGHDFGGRSVGAGALSIWTHNIKAFEFMPSYSVGEYTGMAVRFGSGLEGWELFNHMAEYNISVVAPGGSTVGANGGWFGSGGHGTLASTYGLGSDQALSINVVTASGKLIEADPLTNQDLFYALRGGGAGTYGVVTSVVVKAYPPINMISSSFSLSLNTNPTPGLPPFPVPGNLTLPGNFTGNWTGNWTLFWSAVSIYFRHGLEVINNGGYTYGFIYPLGNNSFSFSSSATFAGKSAAEITSVMKPLYDKLNRIGLNLTNPAIRGSFPYSGSRRGPGGDNIVNTRYRSRLFPRKNWADDRLWNETFSAIRASIEAGYTLHHMQYGPTDKIAGWPGRDSGVNPAWRVAAMHASLMETQPIGLSTAEAKARDAKVQRYLDRWRKVSPGAGAYMNEGDPGEPNWQQSFYGDKYGRLLEIKRKWDPWGVFWAPTTVGSEAWGVRTADGYPGSQNGPLCRVAGRDDTEDGDESDDDGEDDEDMDENEGRWEGLGWSWDAHSGS